MDDVITQVNDHTRTQPHRLLTSAEVQGAGEALHGDGMGGLVVGEILARRKVKDDEVGAVSLKEALHRRAGPCGVGGRGGVDKR